MGLFSWLFESNSRKSRSEDIMPVVNCDGIPMISGTVIDVEGKVFGQCSIDDVSGVNSIINTTTDMFDSPFDSSIDDSMNGFDDSFSSSIDDSF